MYLGVFEPPVVDSTGGFHLRTAFRFDGSRWSSVNAEAARDAEWNLVLFGARVGSMKPGAVPPELPAEGFGNWLGDYRYRPLAATTGSNFRDVDGWKQYPLRVLTAEARRAFRKDAKLDPECSGRNYPDSWIQPLGTAYRSRSGNLLIAMRANPEKTKCEVLGDGWVSSWFWVHAGVFHWLGNEMSLLDAGDYDGDGRSELLFQTAGYNQNGYLLIRVPSLQKVSVTWSYH